MLDPVRDIEHIRTFIQIILSDNCVAHIAYSDTSQPNYYALQSQEPMVKSLQTGTCLLCPLELQPLYLFHGLCVFPVAHTHLPCFYCCVASYLSVMLFGPSLKASQQCETRREAWNANFVRAGLGVRVKTCFARLKCQISSMMSRPICLPNRPTL